MMGRPAEETTVPSPFARDLGYLKRFLTALEAHADTLPAEASMSLRTLLAEEVGRWGQIEALLDGGGETVRSAPAADSPKAQPAAQEPPEQAPTRQRPRFTVGSLLE
jgi:hypothetical protein